MRVYDFNAAIVRSPGASGVNGLREGQGPPPDFAALQAEHHTYVRALEAAGVRVTTLPALEAFPDSVFVEDPALVFSRGAILLRPGAPSRLGEVAELRPALAARFAELREITEGFADGGDVLVTPREILIGLSARTNAAGAAELQKHLHGFDFPSRVVAVPRGTLHLKTDCCLIDEETLLATSAVAESGILKGYRVLTVPEEERPATNAIRVNHRVLMRAGCPRTADLLSRHGAEVVPLPTDEIAKLDAGLSCLSLRWFET
jgi:dimethylargininase